MSAKLFEWCQFSTDSTSPIGNGSFGTVVDAWLQQKGNPNRDHVAIKVLGTRTGKSYEEVLQEAEKEMKLILEAQSRILCHSNIVTVHGLVSGTVSQSPSLQALLGRSDDAVGLVMTYEEGGSLENLLYPNSTTPSPTLSTKDRIHILTDVANGIQEIHRLGIVHKDIKPANILISRRGGMLLLSKNF